MMDAPRIDIAATRQLLETPYVRVFELAYEDGTRYLDASRRDASTLRALASDEELRRGLPDAVGCCLVLKCAGEPPRMVCLREFRYPCGHFVLGLPSGLIDAQDADSTAPLERAMVREIEEECGIELQEQDTVRVVAPFLYNTPGFTDESCALLEVVVSSARIEALSQAGGVGSERFAGFTLLTPADARRILTAGRDDDGYPYPMITWAALTHFCQTFG